MKLVRIETQQQRRVPSILIIAIPAAIALAFWPRLFPLDDSYITLSNARVLLSGVPDPNYGSSYLTGATSPVHLLLIALGSLLVEPLWVSFLVGLAGAALYLLALPKLADEAKLTGWVRNAVVLIGAISGNAFIHYLNGLETSLAMAASAWMLLWRDDRLKLPVLAGIAPFLRPELGLFSVILMLRLAAHSNMRQIMVMALFGFVSAVPWAIWVIIETGHLLPSTMAAKLAWFHPKEFSLLGKAIMTVYWLVVSYQLPLFIGLVGLPKVSRSSTLFVIAGLATAVVVMPEIVDWNFGRYTSIYTPLLVAGVAVLGARRTKVSNAIIGALLVWTFATAVESSVTYAREIDYARRVQDHARFVKTLPASSVVLIHDAGQVAWERPKAKLIDVVGLKTPAVVPINQRLTNGECKREKSLDSIARAYSATHLVVINRWAWPCMAENMRAAGWALRPIYSDLYTVYEIKRPSRLR